jgi:hypothetical protein
VGSWPAKREIECGAFTRFGLGPDSAAMSMNDPRDGGQSNADAFEFVVPMQPLKRAEQVLCVGHIESGTVVSDKVNRFVIILLRSEGDLRYLFVARVFPGIVQKIFQCYAQ